MNIDVSPTTEKATHHVKLSRGTDKIGLVLCNAAGDADKRGLQVLPYPRTSLRTATGEHKYADLELPYKVVVQEDWSGGRGSVDFERDKTMFVDSQGVNTWHPGQVTLGGKATSVLTTFTEDDNSAATGGAIVIGGTNKYWARKLTPSVDMQIDILELYGVGCNWDPIDDASLLIYFVEDNGGDPTGAVLWTGTPQYYSTNYQYDGMSVDEVLQVGITLQAGQTYWLKLASPGSASMYWYVDGENSGNTGLVEYSTDDVTWTPGAQDIAYHFYSIESGGILFEYKQSLYYVTQPDHESGASILYRNGWRGTCDATTYANRIVDATQSWTVDALIGGVVIVIGGTGSDEPRPWRNIADNGTNYLVTAQDWNVKHDTTTEYVVVGLDAWEQVTAMDFTGVVNSYAIANGMVYFGMRGSANVVRYVEHTISGVWTIETGEESWTAGHLLAIPQPDGETVLWGSQNENDYLGNCVWCAQVPRKWGTDTQGGDLFWNRGTLVSSRKAWGEMPVWNVVQSLDDNGVQFVVNSSFTTGTIGRVRLDEAVDIRGAKRIGMVLESSVAMGAGDLYLRYADGHGFNSRRAAQAVMLRQADSLPSAAYYYDGTNWWPLDNLLADDQNLRAQINAWTSAQKVLLGYTQRPNKIRVRNLQANTNTAALTVKYWDADAWVSASITDGTSASSKTFGQDGDIAIDLTSAKVWDKGTDISLSTGEQNLSQDLYWLELTVDATLSTIKIGNMLGVLDWEEGRWINLGQCVDGLSSSAENVNLFADSYLVVMDAQKFSGAYFDLGGTVNAVTATLGVYYFDGYRLVEITETDGTLNGGATLGQDGSVTWTDRALDNWQPQVINGVTGYAIWIKPSAELTGRIIINELDVYTTTYEGVAVPAVTANEPTFVSMAINQYSAQVLDGSAVELVDLYLMNDLGLQTLKIYGDIYLIGSGPDYVPIKGRITGLEAYGDQRKNPWVGIEDGPPVEIQTENGNQAVEVPLGELYNLRSWTNFRATCVHGVYLMFNMGQRVMRYYNGDMEDVGPTRGQGLPPNRQGEISGLLSLPGAVLASIDAGASGYSSVMLLDGTKVHEFYRAGDLDDRIWSVCYQDIPGKGYGRVWISKGSQMVWLPYSASNPLYVTGYEFTSSGEVIVGGISADFLDVEKFLKELKLYTENLSAGHQTVTVSYQLEEYAPTGSWTSLVAAFDSSPFDSNLFSATYDVSGRRLWLKFALASDDAEVTPVLRSWVLQCMMRFEVKYMYTLTFRLEDDDVNLLGEREYDDDNNLVSALEKWTQLQTWLADPKPIYLDFVSVFMDNKWVFPEVGSLRLLKQVVADDGSSGKKERWICQMSLLDV